jgi:hypothetical protein
VIVIIQVVLEFTKNINNYGNPGEEIKRKRGLEI